MNFPHLPANAKMGQSFRKDIWAISYNIRNSLTNNPAVTVSVSTQGSEHPYTQKPAQDVYGNFEFVVAQAWKQSRHSSVGI